MSAPRVIHVSLPSEASEALTRLSRREWRHPRDQAALMLVEGLRRAGALPAEPVTRTESSGNPDTAIPTVPAA